MIQSTDINSTNRAPAYWKVTKHKLMTPEHVSMRINDPKTTKYTN